MTYLEKSVHVNEKRVYKYCLLHQEATFLFRCGPDGQMIDFDIFRRKYLLPKYVRKGQMVTITDWLQLGFAAQSGNKDETSRP